MFVRAIIACITLISVTKSQLIYDCPSDWENNLIEQRCYKFIASPTATYETALLRCSEWSAYPVAINTAQENTFITERLGTMGPSHVWYTSGVVDQAVVSGYTWESDQTELRFDLQYWNEGGKVAPGNRIVYKYNGYSFGWSRSYGNESLSYICEISQQESYAIRTQKRTFYYGVPPTEKDNIKFGPSFLMEPENVVMVSKTSALFVEGIATGNTRPMYKWYKGQNLDQEVTSKSDSRYTLTNGKLSIQYPNQTDENTYRCTAENEFGKVISTTVRITFGFIGDFSNVQDEPARSPAYEGAQIECSQITFSPSVVYNWQRQLRGSVSKKYIYTDLTPYIFISSNGKLYFTEVTTDDIGDYYCQATLHGIQGNAVGSAQPPSRISKAIRLEVQNQAAKTDWGPIIQNDFIAVFPNPPIRGQDIRLECFAYGSAANYQDVWVYQWSRLDTPFMSRRVRFKDLNRVMIIEKAQLEDQGTYECRVSRGMKASDSKTIQLTLESKPYILIPLEDQHLDLGSSLTWRCMFGGNPKAVYSWYKNGVRILGGEDIQIQQNLLTIQKANPQKHNGMYQCAATNIHGTSLSTGQIRVLAFAPSFLKNPLPLSIDAALNGNITIPCQPEAAPTPSITWTRNNMNLGLTQGGSNNGRVRMLPNGYLFITGITYGDSGIYACMAKNDYGQDTSYCTLYVKTGTVISIPPAKLTIVKQNSTAIIRCEASYDRSLDLIYNWEFNGVMLDLERDPNFRMSTSRYNRGLLISMAMFYYDGTYTCIARTPLNEARASGRLRVTGPPGAPIGLFLEPAFVTQTTAKLYWFDGNDHEFKIIYYMVEYQLFREQDHWITPAENTFYAQQTVLPTNTQNNDMRGYVVTGLYPFNSYRFRLKAVNIQGVGPPSIPSSYIQTLPDVPVTYPSNLRGNTKDAKVGDLVIDWDKLPRKFHGGPGLRYRVYWRLLSQDPYAQWNTIDISDWEQEQAVTQVGIDNYYLPYETKIQAINNNGSSTNSSIAIAYSAMGMPIAAPEDVRADGYNSTACVVEWKPIQNTREAMLGRIGGYQVNYWLKSEHETDNPYKQSIRFKGDINHGVVIGLQPDTYYYFEVQVYTDAGLGPRSEKYPAESFNQAPLLYPQEVRVNSDTWESVKVSWRGVSTGTSEDTLKGYKIYVWQANENFRSAKTIDTAKFPTEYILDGVEKGFIYAVRVAGYSNGGDGRKSPTVYFTLSGSSVLYDRTMTSILAASTREYASYILVFICLFISRLQTWRQ